MVQIEAIFYSIGYFDQIFLKLSQENPKYEGHDAPLKNGISKEEQIDIPSLRKRNQFSG